jgi:hypothetical protein
METKVEFTGSNKFTVPGVTHQLALYVGGLSCFHVYHSFSVSFNILIWNLSARIKRREKNCIIQNLYKVFLLDNRRICI